MFSILTCGGPRFIAGFSSLTVLLLTAVTAPAQNYNSAIVTYCEANLGRRVGSGECAHLATEALRVVGAEFTRTDKNGKRIADSPKNGDYVWGELVYKKEISGGLEIEDTVVGKKVRPGDIIQYGGARFANGRTIDHHTAIVAEVDRNGRPTQVYQQNTGKLKGKTDGREVSKGTGIDSSLTDGRVMIYRAVRPSNPAPVQITLTNNAQAGDVTYEYFGKSKTIGGRNTATGFNTLWGRGNGATTITVSGKAYTIESRRGYEFYRMNNGKIGLREVK